MPVITLPATSDGPVLDILVGISETRKRALMASGSQQIVVPAQISAIIDTGASSTCIDSAILQYLGITPTGTTPIITPSTGSQAATCNNYDVSLIIPHPHMNLMFSDLYITESDLSAIPYQALIGRDILSHCMFVYDGQAQRFTLAF